MDWQMFFFSTSGRFNRARYILAMLVYIGVTFVAVLAGLFLLTGMSPNAFAIVYVVGGLIFGAIFFSSMAVAIKRLHDRNKSGWWAVLFLVLPALLNSASTGLVDPSTGHTMQIVAGVLTIWGFVELVCLRGTRGANPFGEDPLANS